MKNTTLYFTVIATLIFTSACAKKTGGGSSTEAAATAGLTVASSAYSLAPGGTSTLSLVGGSAPYTWTVASGGGTLSATNGISVTFTAGSTAGMAYVTVHDSTSLSGVVNISVVSGTVVDPTTPTGTAGNICSGNYAGTLGAYSASFQFSTSGSALSGVMVYGGYNFPLTGTCSTSGMSFTLTETGDTFTGSFVANTSGAARASMSGTYRNVYYGSTQNWTAVPR